MIVSYRLPCSETDLAAAGCTRSRGCWYDHRGPKPCAFHAAETIIGCLTRRLGEQSTLPQGLPLFPDEYGSAVTKSIVIGMYEIIALALDMQIVSSDGGRLWGGHAPRVSGAQYASGIGIELFVSQCIARWASDVILMYVKKAPLKAPKL